MLELPTTPPDPQETAGLLPLAASLYRTARRLTRQSDEAARITWAAVRSVSAGSADDRHRHRERLFAALWREVTALAPGAAASPVPAEEESATRLADAIDGDAVEFERTLLSRLDASPDVDMALRRLPEAERFAVLLVDVEEVPADEVARAMGSDLPTLERRLLAGRVGVFIGLHDYVRRTSGVFRRP